MGAQIEVIDMDKLDDMLDLQRQLQERLSLFKIKDAATKQQFINQMCLALHEETVEMMRETAYKNPEYVLFGWKKGQQFNNERFKEEIVDAWHFLMNMIIISEMDGDEFYLRYKAKHAKNHERQDQSY